MPLYSNLATLVIPKSTIALKYQGGVDRFRRDYRIGDDGNRNQEDDELFGLVAMNPDEFDIDRLVQSGLHFDEEQTISTDFSVYMRYGKPLWELPKLETNEIYIWHADCKSEIKELAQKRGSMYMDELIRLVESGVDVFNTLK